MASLAGVAGEHRGAPAAVKPAAQATSKGAPTATRKSPSQNYGKLPLAFEANQGQTDPRVKFFSRGKGYALFLSGDEAVLSLRAGSQQSKVKGQKAKSEDDLELLGAPSASPAPNTQHPEPAVLRLKLAGAEAGAKVTGLDELPGKSNYFIGNDPKKWRSNVPNYGKVKYEGVYPGIDLVYYGNQRQLEYDFVVAPGADPAAIRLEIVGAGLAPPARAQQAAPLRIDASGDLVISTGAGVVRFHKPVVYQEQLTVEGREPRGTNIEGDPKSQIQNQKPVEGQYVLLADNQVAFKVGSYDRSKPLVIDPVLSYATFLGGTSVDAGTAIAVDSSGNAYVTGLTSSSDFPVTSGVYQTSFKGYNYDAFVTKLDPTGSTRLYSTYLGGTNDEWGISIAVDGNGNAYITGETTSTDFPVTPGALQTACAGTTCDDAFVTKLDPTGATLVYSTYFGGTGKEAATRLVLDASNNVFIAGTTNSTDILIPTSVTPYQATNKGGKDAFLAELNTTGTTLLYFTYLGGTGKDQALDLVLKPGTTTAFLTGSTQSADFPVSPKAYQTALKGTENAFVTAIDVSQAPTSALVFSTYLGGTGTDSASGIALDTSGKVYVAGTTDSTDFPTVSPTQATYGGGLDDMFVAELNSSGSGLSFSTYLGGSNDDQGSRVVVDASGNIFVGGFTDSVDFPTVNPIQAANGGGYDVALTEFSSGAISFSTYLGGANNEVDVLNIGAVGGIALDNAGNLYATSYTDSNDFPVTPGSYQTAAPGGGDAFVVKIGSANATAVLLLPGTLNFGNQNLNIQSGNLYVTMRNMGSAALGSLFVNVQPDASTTGPTDFGQTNNCSNGVSGGGSCTFTVWFTPTATGTRTAVIKITEAPLGTNPRYINLTGTGAQPGASVVPTSINFGSVFVGAQSAFVTVTLTSTGTAPVTISPTTSFIPSSGDFLVPPPNTPGPPACQSPLVLGQPLAPGSSCRIPIFFAPTTTGTRTGTLTITDDAPGSPQIVSLTGVGLLPPIPGFPLLNGQPMPSTGVPFPATGVGVTSASQKVTLSNTGASPLTITSITTDGNINTTDLTFRIDPASPCLNIGGTLAAGVNCDINLTFTPYQLGAVNGHLILNDNAPGSPHTLRLTGTGNPVPFARGEVFISLSNGTVERLTATGSLLQVMDTTLPSYTYGMAFDKAGNLYVTDFGNGAVTKFDNTGVRLGVFAGGMVNPESVVVDSSGNVYVGDAGSTLIRKFDSSGTPVAQYTAAIEIKGTDWIDLASDQCTIFYTSEGITVKRFNTCTNAQLTDFASGLTGTYAYALRLLSSGGLLVADSDSVHRLDGSGNVAQTYTTTPPETALFGLNLDPDGTSFWTGDYISGGVYKIDIASGRQLLTFTTAAAQLGGGFGIAVFGEITAATSPNITLSAGSVNFPGNPVGVNCPTKGVTITNNGPSALTLSILSGITAPFTIDAGSTTCAVNTPVALGQSCVINFKFSPTAVGTVTQTLTITSNAQGSPHSVAVSGTGTPACALLAKAHTATVLRGTDAQDFAIEDAKPSCSPVNINLSCSAANPVACALAPALIAPGGASTLKVTNLKALGADSVSVRVDSTSEFRTAWETMTVFLSDFAFTHAPDSVSVAAGETASYSLAIRPVNGLAGNLSLACSGAPRGASCAVTPSKITLDGASLAQVKVNVSTTARALALPNLPNDGARRTLHVLLMAMLALTLAAVYDRRVRTRLLLAAALGALLLWASCGGGGMNFNASGTPAGTYTMTITGTYSNAAGSIPGTLVNSTTVTLRVN